MRPGDIHRDSAFYIAPTGELKAKYLLVLAALDGRDVVVRLLTSRPHGRPEAPPCFHGAPYAGYFLGIPGGELNRRTWVDLRPLDDLDPIACRGRHEKGLMTRVMTLDAATTANVIECVAGADDTTRAQEAMLRDTLSRLR